MLDKIKKNFALIMTVIAIALFLFSWKQCSDLKSAKQDAKSFDQTVAALNDSIKRVIKKNGDTVYVEKVASFSLKDIVNSEAFKSLSKEKQQFYLELQKTKGLLAAQTAKLHVQDSIIRTIGYDSSVVNNGTTVCFPLGDTTSVKGTEGKLKYKVKLTFADSLKYKIFYQYNINIKSTYVRNKDGSVTMEYKLDDSNASIESGQAYIVPSATSELSKWQRFIRGLNKYGTPIATFIGGYYIGSKIH